MEKNKQTSEAQVLDNNLMVTILMPVSGNPVYLQETIDSVLMQTYKNFEVITVLNNADLWVKRYMQGICARDRRFQLVETTGKGISNALNVGLEKSTHSLICRIDSDDLMHPDRIRTQVEFLSKNQDVGLVGSQINKITKDGKSLGKSTFPTNTRDIRSGLLIRNVIAHPSVMFRKEVVEQIGGYKSQFDGAEDYELWMRIRKTTNLANLDAALTTYRIWPSQETSRNKFLTHNLIRIIHIREVSQIAFMSFPSKPEHGELRTAASIYFKQSLASFLRELKLKESMKLLALFTMDSGIEKLKFGRSLFFKSIGLIQIAIGSLVYARQVLKIYLIPPILSRYSNDKYVTRNSHES